MKKNIENENMNIVENANIVMDNETMQAIVDDNINIVPRNQRRKFEALSLEEKVEKLKMYEDRAKRIEQWKLTSSIEYKVKDLFEKKHGSVEDAQKVIQFCNEFVDNFKLREIEKLDIEIARLEEMKAKLNKEG